MKPPSEAQQVFQHRHLPLISGSAVIWVPRHLCGYLVRIQCQNLPFWLEKPRHGIRQEAVGCKGKGEEGSELGEWMYPMEDKDGQHWKHLGQSSLVLAEKPSTSASDGTSAADRRSLCVLFSWLLVCKRLGTHCLSTDPDLQVPGNGAEGALPQALQGLLLLSLKWASLYSSVCIIQD